MIRLAIIGLGHIGRIHVVALESVEDLRLVAACDHDPALAELVPENVVFYDNYQALLAAGGFNTVVVATPNRSHNAIARDVLMAGYNVIVEKPAANSLAEFDDLEALATERGLHVYYAFHAACALEVNWLVEHLSEQEETYGPPTAFHSSFFDPYINEKGELVPHARSLDECWIDSGVNALSVLDRVYAVDDLRPENRRQSGRADREPGILSVSVQFSFPVSKADLAGFCFIETAWDQGVNFKCTSLYFGHTGWRLKVSHSEQTVTALGPLGEFSELVHFRGERLLNHYLGLFTDYRERVQNGRPMNVTAARRVHSQLFYAMDL